MTGPWTLGSSLIIAGLYLFFHKRWPRRGAEAAVSVGCTQHTARNKHPGSPQSGPSKAKPCTKIHVEKMSAAVLGRMNSFGVHFHHANCCFMVLLLFFKVSGTEWCALVKKERGKVKTYSQEGMVTPQFLLRSPLRILSTHVYTYTQCDFPATRSGT